MLNKKKIILLLLLAVSIAAVFFFKDSLNIEALKQTIKQAGPWGPVIFIGIYIISVIIAFPSALMTLAGGALFGPLWGTLYNLTAATIGASIAFLIARYIAYDLVKSHTQGRLSKLIQGVENEGWHFIAFTRLVPFFPFNLLNYAFGLTKVRLVSYVITSYICMLPGAAAYTYLGHLGSSALAGDKDIFNKALLALALLAIVAYLPKFFFKRKKTP